MKQMDVDDLTDNIDDVLERLNETGEPVGILVEGILTAVLLPIAMAEQYSILDD